MKLQTKIWVQTIIATPLLVAVLILSGMAGSFIKEWWFPKPHYVYNPQTHEVFMTKDDSATTPALLKLVVRNSGFERVDYKIIGDSIIIIHEGNYEIVNSDGVTFARKIGSDIVTKEKFKIGSSPLKKEKVKTRYIGRNPALAIKTGNTPIVIGRNSVTGKEKLGDNTPAKHNGKPIAIGKNSVTDKEKIGYTTPPLSGISNTIRIGSYSTKADLVKPDLVKPDLVKPDTVIKNGTDLTYISRAHRPIMPVYNPEKQRLHFYDTNRSLLTYSYYYDTIEILMLVTTSKNGAVKQRLGYEVVKKISNPNPAFYDKRWREHVSYLTKNKKPIPQNWHVWIATNF